MLETSWMCFRNRGNCVIPPAMGLDGNDEYLTQRERNDGYTKERNRYQGRYQEVRQQASQEANDHGKQDVDRADQDEPDQRSDGGPKESPQADELQRDGRSDGSPGLVVNAWGQDAACDPIRLDPTRHREGRGSAVRQGRPRPIQAGVADANDTPTVRTRGRLARSLLVVGHNYQRSPDAFLGRFVRPHKTCGIVAKLGLQTVGTHGSCVTPLAGRPLRKQTDDQENEMDQQKELQAVVDGWKDAGLWQDAGMWKRARNGAKEYHPTPEEIAAKCELFRSMEERRGVTTKQLFISKAPLITIKAS